MNDEILNNNQILMDEISPVEVDYSSQKKTATDSIESFMESENVSLICYIDDRADIESSKPTFLGSINAIYDSEDKPHELDFIDWTINPKQKFKQSVSDFWDGSSDPEKKDYFHKLSIYNNDSNTIPALEIEELLKDKIKLFSPKEWVADNYKIFKELGEGKRLLCLFDIEFTNGAKLADGRDGLDLAKHLLDSEHNSKCLCGVFSHLFSIEEEDEKRYEYIAAKGLPAKQFYTISKNRFAFDPKISAFAEGIKNLVLLPYVENLIEQSIVSFTDAFTKSVDRIMTISPKTFNQIVQKSSLKEGVWEIITLFRLHGIIAREENYNIITDPAKRKVFNADVNKIREIDLIETGYDSKSNNQQLISLRNSELYLTSNIINTLHLPLTNGDIFEIKGKEYILLVQPCNLAVRAHDQECGKRDYKYDTGILIPLKYIEKDALNINVEEIKIAEVKNKFYVAYFPGIQIVSLDILDLVVFNESGNAIIDLNRSSLTNDVIHFPWKVRYEYIYKNFIKYETKINEFKSLKEGINLLISQKKDALKVLKDGGLKSECAVLNKEIGVLKKHFENTENNILNIEDLKKFNIKCSTIYNPATRIIDMKIKRVRHYKSPYSDDLLQKFMLYLSRNAFDHDFTNS